MSEFCPACKAKLDDGTIRCVCGYEIDLIPDHETPLDFAEKTIHPGRLIIQGTSTGYEIIIPPKRSGLIYVRLGLYIIGCVILEALSMASYFGKRKVLNLPETETELLFLMGALAIGVGFMLYAWLWKHHDTDTFRFGLSIDEGEAQFIANEMHKRNPFRVI